MKRRDFNAAMLAAMAGATINGTHGFCNAGPSGEFDRYGGWKGKTFESTGYFRVEQDDRWWFVTPEGNAFLSFGVNHLHPDLWRQDFNREVWREKLGVSDLDDRAEFNAALRSWFLKTCREWGFNTAGVHTSLNVINRPQPELAYLQPIQFVDIPHYKPEVPDENFVDVFSIDFAKHCDRMAIQSVAPDDPFLVGYTMTDCPLLTELDCRERPDVIGGARRKSRIGWPRRLRNLSADSAGKRAYVETVRKLYRDSIAEFNKTYQTEFESFDALVNARDWRLHTDLSNANETRDNVEFLKQVVDKYYATARDAIRRHDPNHMFFGDKLNANTDSVDTVLPVTEKYIDAVLYQMYGRYEVQEPGLDRWARVTSKPFVNGDSSFTMVTEFMPRPYGPVADDLKQRADWTTEFFLQAFAREDFIGWHYCGLIDATQRTPYKAARQHSGLLNEFGEPYPELFKSLSQCTDRLYQIALGNV